MFVGLILILIGGFFLLQNLNIIPYWVDWHDLWPAVLIALGISMVFDVVIKRSRRSERTE